MTDAGRTDTLMTAEDLYAIPDDDQRYELVNGVLHVSEPPKFWYGWLAARLVSRLDAYVSPRGLGAVVAECGYVLRRGPDTVRGPDVSFIDRDRLPDEHTDQFIEGAPDLVIEIVAPGDRRRQIVEKVESYLEAGARLVWVVYPARRQIVVRTPEGPVEVLRIDDTLDGSDVVPGFRLALAELFGAAA